MGCFFLGAALSFILYRRDKKLVEFAKWLIPVMAGLRFLSISIIAILILGPLLKYYAKRVEQTIIAIVHDNSNSIIQSKDSTFIKGEFLNLKNQLKERLGDKYELENFVFSEDLISTDDEVDYSGQVSDISASIKGLESRFYNRNLGAIVYISDGIFNQGSNPIYEIKSIAPIYAVALGDTAEYKDASINRINQNKVAFLGNDFPVELDLKFLKAKGERVSVSILKDNQSIFTKELEVESALENIEVKTNIEAKQIGLQRYTVKISSLDGEFNLNNNQQDFFIDVLDGRQRILILSDAPHPDINAIKSALKENESYEVESFLYANFMNKIEDYSLVIFYQLSNSAAKDPYLAKAAEKNIATLFVAGASTNLYALNQQKNGLVIDSEGSQVNRVTASFNEGFPLFQLSENTIAAFRNMPPMLAPFGKYNLNGQNFVLLNQQIGTVKTSFPLLSFTERNGRKLGLLAAEGYWRWRIADYAANSNHDASNELIIKTAQFLAIKADKSYFRISHEESFFENENIRIDAQLFNESYELTNEPEVEIVLRNESDVQYDYSFTRNRESYFVNINGLPVGNYSYLSKVSLAGKTFTEKGEFSIKPRQLESQNTIANHTLLAQLANNSGGELVQANQILSIADKIEAREDIASVAFREEEIEDIINLEWIFYLIIGLLSLEWFIRKRGGAY